MPKAKLLFFCQNCGFESTKWMGQCPGCKEWNTFAEEPQAAVPKKTAAGSVRKDAPHPKTLSEIEVSQTARMTTGMGELDRALGGGIVQGSLVLVGGDPGIGKSTLLLQVCRNLSAAGKKVLYISGEESLQQIRLRAERMGTFTDLLLILCETSLETIREAIARIQPEVVIIDSIQTMYNENVSSAPGSVSQVRESTGVLMQIAKGMNITIFIVGHVTKEGVVAGPRVLEHMVDTVLYFEGDRYASYRIFVAEVASTCNEALLIHDLLGRTKDETEKKYLINYFLDQFKGTMYRQTMFAEFERTTHQAVSRGETLTAENLHETYLKLNQDYFGPAMTVDREIGYEWERIPHFYTPFYVYQYATGFAAAIAISSKILSGEPGIVEKYKKFLSSGSSMDPIDLLKICGVDMSSPQPVLDALGVFEEYLAKMEAEVSEEEVEYRQ